MKKITIITLAISLTITNMFLNHYREMKTRNMVKERLQQKIEEMYHGNDTVELESL